MADVVDAATRSRMMSGIRGKNTKPELRLRKALHALGFRYRIHATDLPGKPDVVLPRWNAVVLVHGCFWHRHPDCRFATTPSSRTEFWQAKFDANIARDKHQLAEIRRLGWRTATIWECNLRRLGSEVEVAEQLAQWLRSGSSTLELPPS